MSATTVVVNVQVATGDTRRPWATGLAIRGTTLAVIGSAAEIQKLADATTRVVDAGGRTLRLPAGVSVGSAVRVDVMDDGDVVVHSLEELS